MSQHSSTTSLNGYVEMLKGVHERAVAEGKSEKEIANAEEAYKLANTMLEAFNGKHLAAIAITMPLLVGLVRAGLHYLQAAVTPANPVSEDEVQLLETVHANLEEAVDTIHVLLYGEELEKHQAGTLSDEAIDTILRKLPDDSNDA